MKEDDDIESKPFMSTAYKQKYKQLKLLKMISLYIERLRKVHEVFETSTNKPL